MDITVAVLVRAVEASFAMLPETEGLVSYLSIRGIHGHETRLSHPMLNMITSTALTPANADAAIKLVRDHFAEQDKAFGWVIGPSTKPDDLGARLLSAGLTKLFDAAGMTLTDLGVRFRVNPAVKIHEVTPQEVAVASETMAEAFPAPREVVHLMYEILFRDRQRLKTRIYLAFLEGSETPVACSSMGFIPGQPIVHLRGAATVKQHRGKGIYTSLLARRLNDARRDGAQAAVIQAIRTTSAPVCRRLGFNEVCSLEFYTWSPPELTAGH
jgi:GNAT superfamily N-acetyltransferase